MGSGEEKRGCEINFFDRSRNENWGGDVGGFAGKNSEEKCLRISI
jgi:hypothetical protein